jgi:hypothetical protein
MADINLLIRLNERQAELLLKAVSALTAKQVYDALESAGLKDEDYVTGGKPTVHELLGLLSILFLQGLQEHRVFMQPTDKPSI